MAGDVAGFSAAAAAAAVSQRPTARASCPGRGHISLGMGTVPYSHGFHSEAGHGHDFGTFFPLMQTLFLVRKQPLLMGNKLKHKHHS